MIVLAFFMLAPLEGLAQQSLLFYKGRKLKAAYQAGESIRFKLIGENIFHEGLIQGFTEDAIRFHYYTVSVSDIEAIDIKGRGGNFINGLSVGLIQAGVFFLFIDQVNRVAVRGRPAGLDNKTAAIGLGLIVPGLVLQLFKKQRFKLRGKKKLVIVGR